MVDQENSLWPTNGRKRLVEQIISSDEAWVASDRVLDLPGDQSWRPDLVKQGTKNVLHIQLTDRLPRHIVRRLKAAASAGMKVHVALSPASLWDDGNISCLSETNASVLTIPHQAVIVGEPEDLLSSITKLEIPLALKTRRAVALSAWERCKKATSANEKGHRLESLLAFLLGQCRELRVVERRLRTKTEEIDLVAQPCMAGLSRCWVIPGSPFILVEAKNWSSKIGKPIVSDMLLRLSSYRGTAKIGILVGACGFTRDALNHELRYSSEEGTIAFVGPAELEGWIEASDLDEYFEELVRRAMLR